ncbi:formate-dependent phosphoribosylglycinamide formyltransferase [Flavimarina sp. Hel_I_48]|uniref:formate-dependent phosphoribosylglycinamide formyltransferase n=1 Tax=Flavimarina sp. Hel_I_48 TaxID=1392488 RepID=UPI0004DF6DA0|nr:formate-dependent phosphoribosylglycinamide formyltransferase [Flavimarina sp. Hel_I_48]
MATFLLLGSGELGKEFAIAAQRLGQKVIAVDRYANAPAMQVSHAFEVVDMLNGNELDKIVEKYKPDFIVPEIEAIRTERFYDYEKEGITVVPSAKAANFAMNRKAVRDLASLELDIKTAKYRYASSLAELETAAKEVGFPCIVKPLMSSSGKGQSTLKSPAEIPNAWQHAHESSRGDITEVIVEEFIKFEYEITLLTLTQSNGKTLFCAPIGHRQENGDYRESWQPAEMIPGDLKAAQEIAKKITEALGGAGIWGVEFFVTEDEVYFSELSPRPHDTGMVTLAHTQNFNQFELHLRAILGLPIPEITLDKMGASAVIISTQTSMRPTYKNVEIPAAMPKTDFRIFGKPTAFAGRRMGVVVSYDDLDSDMSVVRERAFQSAKEVIVTN